MVKNAARKKRIREIMAERGVNYMVAQRINDEERLQKMFPDDKDQDASSGS